VESYQLNLPKTRIQPEDALPLQARTYFTVNVDGCNGAMHAVMNGSRRNAYSQWLDWTGSFKLNCASATSRCFRGLGMADTWWWRADNEWQTDSKRVAGTVAVMKINSLSMLVFSSFLPHSSRDHSNKRHQSRSV
jgi:hypothetical protein